MSEIEDLLRGLKKYGNAGRDCAISAEDALTLAAALEAAREDACVSLVADIRFACGDNGKRMQPELVEYIRDLAEDAERWRHARRILTVEDIESSQDMFDAFGVEGDEHENRKADAAIDQARGKGVAG